MKKGCKSFGKNLSSYPRMSVNTMLWTCSGQLRQGSALLLQIFALNILLVNAENSFSFSSKTSNHTISWSKVIEIAKFVWNLICKIVHYACA